MRRYRRRTKKMTTFIFINYFIPARSSKIDAIICSVIDAFFQKGENKPGVRPFKAFKWALRFRRN